jgi:hypothetical protein
MKRLPLIFLRFKLEANFVYTNFVNTVAFYLKSAVMALVYNISDTFCAFRGFWYSGGDDAVAL